MLAWRGVGDSSRAWPRLLPEGCRVGLMDEVISLTTAENTSPARKEKAAMCIFSTLGVGVWPQ